MRPKKKARKPPRRVGFFSSNGLLRAFSTKMISSIPLIILAVLSSPGNLVKATAKKSMTAGVQILIIKARVLTSSPKNLIAGISRAKTKTDLVKKM